MLGNTNNKVIDDSKTLKNIEDKLSALLALISYLSFDNKDGKEEKKAEVILSEAGLENTEIAKILGKQLGAVQKTIQRAKK